MLWCQGEKQNILTTRSKTPAAFLLPWDPGAARLGRGLFLQWNYYSCSTSYPPAAPHILLGVSEGTWLGHSQPGQGRQTCPSCTQSLRGKVRLLCFTAVHIRPPPRCEYLTLHWA